jgi:hypothetical protein
MTIRQLLRKYGKEFTDVLKREIRVNRLVASGNSLRSITFDTVGLNLNIYYDKAIAIQNDGINKKRIPDSRLILQWMIDKNIRPRASRTAGNNSFTNQSERNLKASAWLIAKAIGERGTIKRFGYRGSNVLDHLSPESKTGKLFAKDLGKMFEIEIDNIFTNQQLQ